MKDSVEIFGRNYQFITKAQAETFEDYRVKSFLGNIDANTCERKCYEYYFGVDFDSENLNYAIHGLIKRYMHNDTGVFWIINHNKQTITYDGIRSMRIAAILKYISDEDCPCLISKEEFDSINKRYSKYFYPMPEKIDKKIIGYTLKKDKYELISVVNLIINSITEWDARNTLTIDSHAYFIKKLTDAGVLDIWFESVYEEEFKDIEIGEPKCVIRVYKTKIVADNKEFSINSISDMHKALYDMYLKPDKNNSAWDTTYQVQVLEFKLGCTKFKIEDLQKIIRTSKELIHGL
jgi:hypothetical protein